MFTCVKHTEGHMCMCTKTQTHTHIYRHIHTYTDKHAYIQHTHIPTQRHTRFTSLSRTPVLLGKHGCQEGHPHSVLMLLQDPPSTVLLPSGSDLGVSQRLLGPTSHFIPSGFPREPAAAKSTADMGLHGHGSPATGLSTQKITGLPGCGPEQHLSASGGERCPHILHMSQAL